MRLQGARVLLTGGSRGIGAALARGSVAGDLDAQSRSYGPLRRLAERSGGRDVVPMERVVGRLVRAIEREEAEVRVPAAMAPLAGMANLPRRAGRMLSGGTPARPDAP